MTCCGNVGFGTHGTVRPVAVHRRAISQAEDTAHFVIQLLGACFSFFYQPQIGLCQIIVVVCIARPVRKSVCPTAKFHVQSVVYGFFRVVYASPIGNDHAVEAPFSLQDVIQQILVMAGVLVFIEVV